MEAVQIEETATILRFVVMFASGDGLAVLFAASNATDWGFRDVRNRRSSYTLTATDNVCSREGVDWLNPDPA
jgi:hypothetical protein